MIEKMDISVSCFEVVDRTVGPGGNSGRIHVPKAWVGKKVRVLLLEPIEEK
jgi:putative transposon-encoded protein